MSFTLINRSFFSILSLLFLFSCSTKTVYEKIKPNTYEVPLVENIDDEKINIINVSNKQIDFENKLSLKVGELEKKRLGEVSRLRLDSLANSLIAEVEISDV